MAYMHILNLYRDARVLEFKRLYALEKIHGTSASLHWCCDKNPKLRFFSGGANRDSFVKLFDNTDLPGKFEDIGQENISVFGEAYGGKLQGMKATYGNHLCFVAFEVKINDTWLSVQRAEHIVLKLGLEFVYYELIDATMEKIDAQRDVDSVQAERNGMGAHKREGIVLRPPFEVTLNDNSRLIAKHKRDDFRETKTSRKVGIDPEVLTNAHAIAEEWVTPMRLEHVLDKLPEVIDITHTPVVLGAMLEDVLRESAGEFEATKLVEKAIRRATAILWKQVIRSRKFSLTIDNSSGSPGALVQKGKFDDTRG